ncbi:MAG: adenosylcobalamin-dependent ribonucleoside-diphosphate reductase [archaeon]
MVKYNNGSIDNLDIPESSVTVLESRYLTKDSHGEIIETGEELMRRVAWDMAVAEAFFLEGLKERVQLDMTTEELYEVCKGDKRVEKIADDFFEMMSKCYFLPNSPTLMNAGKKLQQLSACFVLPMGDSIEEIFDTQKNMAVVHKSGGGTGFSFSRLRPNGSMIHSTQGYSPGPLSFLFSFNESAGQITQGGKRRGANMGIIRANHPDALCFTKVKGQEGLLANFNLSIAFNDEEMRAIKEGGYILLENPQEGKEYTVENAKNRVKDIVFGRSESFKTSWKLSEDETKVIDRYNGDEIGKVEDGKIYLEARRLFGTIVEGVWQKGEPGIIFIDKINDKNPTPELGKIESTNPCGEQPLLPYESCNLGSINVSNMVKNGEVDKELFEKVIRLATRFLDNVIDRNNYPLKEIREMTLGNRKIGLGVMGFAHMLVKKGVSYNSNEAVEIAEEVMKFIQDVSKDESRKLAKEKFPFPNFYKSIFKQEETIRNATTTTIAPTGTIGVIASSSQGIEPIFRLVTIRNVKETIGKDLVEIDRSFKEYLEEKGLYGVVIEKMKQGKEVENIKELDSFRDEIKRLFVTAHDVTPGQHLKIQAAFQKYTDNAVSKTINMPNEATREDVAKAYFLAHELGCKGITIYRDGSRDKQLLTAVKTEEKSIKNMERPVLIGTTVKQATPHGKAFITLNCIQNSPLYPYEVFINIGKGGRDIPAIAEGLGRILSIAFKEGVTINDVAEQLEGISGETQTGFGIEKIFSLPDAIAKGLKEAYLQLEGRIEEKEKSIEDAKKEELKISGNFCPDCGGTLMFIEGCQKCMCGYSKC